MGNKFVEYANHGWWLTRIMPGLKGPRHKGWNTREKAITDPEKAKRLEGAGLLHSYSGTAALDIDRLDDAGEWLKQHGIDLLALLEAPDAVQIESGVENRGKLLYAMPEPLRSKSFDDGSFELRCATASGRSVQDLLPPTIHPKTGQSYQWKGDWRHLPLIPDELLHVWRESVGPPQVGSVELPAPTAGLAELRELVMKRDADCGYDDWIEVAMVIHYETNGSDNGLALCNEWSAKGEKYKGIEDLKSHWDSFGRSDRPVTIASLRAGAVSTVDEFEREERITQDNVARVFEHRYKDEFRYCKPMGGWFHWDGKRWEVEKTGLALDNARQLAREVNPKGKYHIATKGFAKAVEELAMVARCFVARADQWDRADYLLNTPEGTVDLLTGEVRAHRREDLITQVTLVSAAPGPMPIFDQFMRDITMKDTDLIDYLHRSLGACLSGAINDHFASFWYGPGRNGKNTLGDLICEILGDYAKVIPSETLMASKQQPHPTGVANLMGTRLAISSEVREGAFLDEALIKSLTGDQEISARFMRQDHFVFRRTHKHLIFGNHRPILRVVDDGIRNRLHIVPFKAQFIGEQCDPYMKEKLRAEAPQILNWLIEGHQKWVADKERLRKCPAVEAETEDYFDSQSTTESWLEERCILDPTKETRAKELYSDYRFWKESRGEHPVNQKRWGEFMGQRFKKRKSNGVIYQGVRLRDLELAEPSPLEISSMVEEFADLL